MNQGDMVIFQPPPSGDRRWGGVANPSPGSILEIEEIKTKDGQPFWYSVKNAAGTTSWRVWPDHLHPVSFIDLVLWACRSADAFHDDRTLYSVLGHAMSEMGEVGLEVTVAMGDSYKPVGSDGVVGEAVDTIAALIDLIYRARPDITETELSVLAAQKCGKWLSHIRAAKAAGTFK
jgi:hypothetical protein